MRPAARRHGDALLSLRLDERHGQRLCVAEWVAAFFRCAFLLPSTPSLRSLAPPYSFDPQAMAAAVTPAGVSRLSCRHRCGHRRGDGLGTHYPTLSVTVMDQLEVGTTPALPLPPCCVPQMGLRSIATHWGGAARLVQARREEEEKNKRKELTRVLAALPRGHAPRPSSFPSPARLPPPRRSRGRHAPPGRIALPNTWGTLVPHAWCHPFWLATRHTWATHTPGSIPLYTHHAPPSSTAFLILADSWLPPPPPARAPPPPRPAACAAGTVRTRPPPPPRPVPPAPSTQ